MPHATQPAKNPFRVSSESSGATTVVRLEGWLAREGLPLVVAACRDARSRGDAVVLELSGLRSLGAHEAASLSALSGGGVALRGATGFVRALLSGPSQ